MNKIQEKIKNTNFPLITGILNITNDSFFDGGKYLTEKNILQRVSDLFQEGADIIDIGAQSSRPGAEFLTAKEEIQKLLPALQLIKKNFPNILLSVDTFWSEVAEISINEGVDMINDISSGNIDPKMFQVIKKYQIPYVLMHMKGNPQNMHLHTNYINILEEMLIFFKDKLKFLRELGIDTQNIFIDPGFGFSKTVEQNYYLLNHLDKFSTFGLPLKSLYIGISRKSMIYKPLKTTPQESLCACSALHLQILQKYEKEVAFLRVHDVKEIKQLYIINQLINESNSKAD